MSRKADERHTRSITDIAIERGLTYQATREAVLRGDFGKVTREHGRLLVWVEEKKQNG